MFLDASALFLVFLRLVNRVAASYTPSTSSRWLFIPSAAHSSFLCHWLSSAINCESLGLRVAAGLVCVVPGTGTRAAMFLGFFQVVSACRWRHGGGRCQCLFIELFQFDAELMGSANWGVGSHSDILFHPLHRHYRNISIKKKQRF